MKSQCSVDGCEKANHCKGLCSGHYHRLVRHGDPLAGATRNGAPLNFIKTVLRHETNDCVDWPFSCDGRGYGKLYVNRKLMGAYVVTCEAFHGGKPSPKHEVAHTCGNRKCVNPRHLRWATRSENHLDKRIHGTMPLGESNLSAKLKASDIHRIRKLRGKTSAPQVAQKFNVSPSTIRDVWVGKTWAHL